MLCITLTMPLVCMAGKCTALKSPSRDGLVWPARQGALVIFSTTMGNLWVRVLVCVGACVHAFVPVCVHAWVCPYFSVCRHAWVCPYVSVCVHVLCWLASMLTMPFGKPQD